jgi:hypothetical protein
MESWSNGEFIEAIEGKLTCMVMGIQWDVFYTKMLKVLKEMGCEV